jgi:hypothetical protein
MEIAESSPASRVTMKLAMINPFEAHNMVEFTLQPAGDHTNVTWSMQSSLPYVAKAGELSYDMDSMVGKDFEAGLASLKAVAEK